MLYVAAAVAWAASVQAFLVGLYDSVRSTSPEERKERVRIAAVAAIVVATTSVALATDSLWFVAGASFLVVWNAYVVFHFLLNKQRV